MVDHDPASTRKTADADAQVRKHPDACVAKGLQGEADHFLLNALSANAGVCTKMRAAGLVALWVKLIEDTPENNKPKQTPLSVPNWYTALQGLTNIVAAFSEIGSISRTADKADARAIRVAMPAAMARVWRDKAELEGTHPGSDFVRGAVAFAIYNSTLGLDLPRDPFIPVLRLTPAIPILALCWLHTTDPTRRTIVSHALNNLIPNDPHTRSLNTSTIESFARAVPPDAIVNKFLELLDEDVDFATMDTALELGTLNTLLDIDCCSSVQSRLSARVDEMFGVLERRLRKCLRVKRPKDTACWWDTAMKYGSAFASFVACSPSPSKTLGKLLANHDLLGLLGEAFLVGISLPSSYKSPGSGSESSSMTGGSYPTSLGGFDNLARVVLLYWNGEGILGPGGHRRIPVDPGYRAQLLPQALFYCEPVLDSLRVFLASEPAAWAMWAGIAEAVGIEGMRVVVRPVKVGCWNVGCERFGVECAQVKARCGGCKVAMYCSSACQTTDWTVRHKKTCRIIAYQATT